MEQLAPTKNAPLSSRFIPLADNCLVANIRKLFLSLTFLGMFPRFVNDHQDAGR